MKSKGWMILIALGIAISFVACSSPSPEVGVEVTVEPPQALPTLPACTEDEEITLDVHSMKSGEIQVQGQGFMPKESLTLIFIAQREVSEGTGKTIIQISSPYAVDAEGAFSEQDSFLPLNANESPEWELRVVHQRGVACTTFKMQ